MPPDEAPDEPSSDLAPLAGTAFLEEPESQKVEAVDQVSEYLRAQLKDPGTAHETAVQVVSTTLLHAGPLPPPASLQMYEEIVPGAAREIVDMAKAEQKHRHEMELLNTQYPYRASTIAGLLLTTCVVGAGIAVLSGSDYRTVAIFLSLPVVSTIGLLLKGLGITTSR